MTISCLVFACHAWANNVRLSNLVMEDAYTLSIDIAWDHAWDLDTVQAPFNHDAVWLFVKIQDQPYHFLHADLSTDSAAFEIDNAVLGINTVADGKGIFVRRTDGLAANVPASKLTLRLSQAIPAGAYSIQVFAIEMVWINSEAFYLGDSTSFDRLGTGADVKPLLVNAENALPIGNGTGQLQADSTAIAGNVPSAFPKGYQGFYCMKYEISQSQYVDFLNTLSAVAQQQRVINPTNQAGYSFSSNPAFRNGIVVQEPSNGNVPALFDLDGNFNSVLNELGDGGDRACSFLSWADVAAFLDWAALRPMTELEYEKACRGPEVPVAGGFAWGTPLITDANTLANDGFENESVTDSLAANAGFGSHGYDGPTGPLRSGFGGNDSSTRLSMGASYYGVAELSGNLWEYCVTVSSPQGLLFSGALGDGELDTQGNANIANWPLADGTGAGHRGGAWNSGILPTFRDLAVSDRFYINLKPSLRRGTGGGRGVR
ncbi:MAG: SUMF1/EgtB/PvdO family nonheme iron enzyme [Chitinophagales bacterium]|nr:SUMF1/EgtB/PvdO family nonheme iron enzyme [Chitinophagales bacterium]